MAAGIPRRADPAPRRDPRCADPDRKRPHPRRMRWP